MKNYYQPVIVIVAFNRTHTLQRILSTLDRAVCPKGTKLIISIDNDGNNQRVAEIGNEYKWKNGEKQVIYHKERLGMRSHYNFCGDLTYEYGSAIILEDDMVVSPHFYNFGQECLNYYKDSDEIAGISLYNLPYTEASKLPFIPLMEDSDVYFSQVPCSLSMTYSVEQWDRFRKWFDLNPDLKSIKGLPMIVTNNWSQASWKKYMYGYMVVEGKFFIYPQVSYSSNFNDLGTNMVTKSYWGQVSLQMLQKEIKFKPIEDSVNVYDAYSEILPDRLKRLNESLKDFDFEVDLYGQKESFTKEFVLTSKTCKAIIHGFERAMKPQELNIVYNIRGEDFKLARRKDVVFSLQNIKDLIFKTIPAHDYVGLFAYYYTNVPDTRILISILKLRMKNRLRGYLRKK
ncbi:MAG: hypothetical protein R2764_00080 [Bacteroidales bacterium]